MTGSQKRDWQALGGGQEEGDLDVQSISPVGRCHWQDPLVCTASVLQFFKRWSN